MVRPRALFLRQESFCVPAKRLKLGFSLLLFVHGFSAVLFYNTGDFRIFTFLLLPVSWKSLPRLLTAAVYHVIILYCSYILSLFSKAFFTFFLHLLLCLIAFLLQELHVMPNSSQESAFCVKPNTLAFISP